MRYFICLVTGLSGLTSHTLRHHAHEGGGRAELIVRLHEEVVLACDAGSGGGVAWKHDGRSVTHGAAYRMSANSLRIARAGPQDEGAWQCEERDPRTRATRTTAPVYILILGKKSQLAFHINIHTPSFF